MPDFGSVGKKAPEVKANSRYHPWRVVVFESTGDGGANEVEYWFKGYDLAHEFYMHIKAQAGKPFHSSISIAPHLQEFPLAKVHTEKFW